MALIKKETLDSGVDVEYIKINNVTYSKDQKIVAILYDVYKDKSARDAKKQPVKSNQRAMISFNAVDAVNVNPIALAYDKMKTLKQFDGAVDG